MCCSFFLCARLLRKQQFATSVANVRRSSMSARLWRHLRLSLPKHLAPSRIKTFFNRRALLFFLRARLLRKRQLATSVANVRRSSMSARHWRHLRLPLPKHLAPSRIKTYFNRRALLFFCVRCCCMFLYDVATSSGVRSPFIYIYLKILNIHYC